MLKLTNYISEVYKQFCDLIDLVSVKMLMARLQCACGIGDQSCELFLVGMAFHPGIPSLHFDTSSTPNTSSVPTRKRPFDNSSESSSSWSRVARPLIFKEIKRSQL